MTPPAFARDDLVAEARKVLDDAVDEVLASEEAPPVVERLVLEGAAAEQLVRHSEDADLSWWATAAAVLRRAAPGLHRPPVRPMPAVPS